MDQFYKHLEALKIYSGPDVFAVVPEMEVKEIVKLGMDCYLLTESDASMTIDEGIFNFSASSAICGGVYPCAEIPCRLKNVYELSVFAALYADKVLIPNFFEHLHDLDPKFTSGEGFFNFTNRLMGDIVLMLDLKPLIQEGIVCINPRMKTYCNHCVKLKISQEKKFVNFFKRIEKKLAPKIYKQVKFTLDTNNSIVIKADKSYVATEALRFIVLPPVFKKYIKKIPYTFNAGEVEKLGLNELLLVPIFNDLILQKCSMDQFNISYLTNRKLETEIINCLEIEVENEKQDRLILDALAHELPFVKNADIGKLLEMRKKEKGAFVAYRDAVRKTFMAVKGEKNINVVKKAVQDNIIPEVNKIERIIEIHKNDLRHKLKGEIAFDAIVISAGLFATSIGADLNEVVKAFGGIFTTKTLFGDALPLTSAPKEAQGKEYYFLWKLKNES
jgi:hypothetical protein